MTKVYFNIRDNPKCNASACPQYKCGTHLIAANLTAGECCDRCAPATNEPEVKSSETPSSSSSEEEREENDKSSSSEEDSKDNSGCDKGGFKAKQHRIRKYS